MAHLIDRDAADPVSPVIPIIGRAKWFPNDFLLSNFFLEIVGKLFYETDPAFTKSDM